MALVRTDPLQRVPSGKVASTKTMRDAAPLTEIMAEAGRMPPRPWASRQRTEVAGWRRARVAKDLFGDDAGERARLCGVTETPLIEVRVRVIWVREVAPLLSFELVKLCESRVDVALSNMRSLVAVAELPPLPL